MTINETLAALAADGAIPGVRVYLELPTVTAVTPAMFVRDVDVDYTSTFGEIAVTVALVVLVQYADKATAPGKLNDLLDFAAVPAALVALGYSPQGATGKALYTFGGATLLGAEIITTIDIPT